MAQRDEVAGLFGGHDGGDAGYAQHVAFFCGAVLHNRQGFGLHGDEAFGDCNAVGGGLGAYVNHMGLALGIKVGEGRHGFLSFGIACVKRYRHGEAGTQPSTQMSELQACWPLGAQLAEQLYPHVIDVHAAAQINQGIIVGC